MSKITTIFIALLIAALASYSVYMNIELNRVTGQQEAMNAETAKKFTKLSEELIRANEELATQKAIVDEAAVAAQAAALPLPPPASAAMTSAQPSQPATQPVIQPAPAQPSNARMTKKTAAQSTDRQKAEKAKAQVEALLGEDRPASEPWETREAHL